MHIDHILKIFLSNGILISCVVSIDRMRDINLEVLLFLEIECRILIWNFCCF